MLQCFKDSFFGNLDSTSHLLQPHTRQVPLPQAATPGLRCAASSDGAEWNPPTVADTKRKFYEAFRKPVPGLYNNIIQELLVQQHLMRFNRTYRYDEVRFVRCSLFKSTWGFVSLVPRGWCCRGGCQHEQLYLLRSSVSMTLSSQAEEILGLADMRQVSCGVHFMIARIVAILHFLILSWWHRRCLGWASRACLSKCWRACRRQTRRPSLLPT